MLTILVMLVAISPRRNGSISRELGCGINSNFGKIHHSACTFCFEASADKKDDEESTRRQNRVRCYYPEDGGFDYFDNIAVVTQSISISKKEYPSWALGGACISTPDKKRHALISLKEVSNITLAQFGSTTAVLNFTPKKL
ncbi:hypothetical protein GOP47_0005410 [Adiantum capillus-veneris]|uniref:Uncharacterized protein n=1 Tax=Adiantum capillus-veneris TaxID=13818 RepID=A0A9D4ZNJ3_ADICA|nr:hypothetical protein GOP47_0005410 [Adiantum capillus-veneris]